MNYLYGEDVDKLFEKRKIRYELSNNTNRLRFIYVDDKLFATIRSNGTYALTIHGANILINYSDYMRNCVMIKNDVEQFIKVGGSVFNKHIIDAGKNVLPVSYTHLTLPTILRV